MLENSAKTASCANYLPEEMVEGVGYFQFVYADGETRTFRYALEEQGLWIGENERCLVDGQAFYALPGVD